MYKKTLLFTMFLCNALHGMENNETNKINETPLSFEIKKFNDLLTADLADTSKAIELLTTGWPDSKKCLYSALASVGVCAFAFVSPKDIGPQIFGMGATMAMGSGALSVAAMYNETKKRDIYLQDQTKLNDSAKKLTQIMNNITHTNTTNDFQQSVVTSSATRPVTDKSLGFIQTCNTNYDNTLRIIKNFIAEYPTSKICFYTTLVGLLLCSIAWLSNKNNSARFAGMGSVLFIGGGAAGIASALHEEKILESFMNNKIGARGAIMEINRK